MNKTPLSTEYPKYLHKRGSRSEIARDEDHERDLRDKGFSHEAIVAEPSANWQNPSLTANTGSGKSADNHLAGTVPTSTMDALLEVQKNKFDRAWEMKCNEAAAAKAEADVALKANAELAAAQAKLKADHDSLVAEHVKLLTEHNSLLGAQNAKPGVVPAKAPITPPIAVAKG